MSSAIKQVYGFAPSVQNGANFLGGILAKEDLDPRDQLFVKEYLRTSNATAAAAAAGFTAKNQHSLQVMASKVLNRPQVQAELKKIRNEVQAETKHGLVQAMKEAQDAMAYAKKTENANAYVKAVELRAKLNGLLTENINLRHAGFSVVVGGIDFDKRDGKTAPPEIEQQISLPAPVEEDDEDIFG